MYKTNVRMRFMLQAEPLKLEANVPPKIPWNIQRPKTLVTPVSYDASTMVESLIIIINTTHNFTTLWPGVDDCSSSTLPRGLTTFCTLHSGFGGSWYAIHSFILFTPCLLLMPLLLVFLYLRCLLFIIYKYEFDRLGTIWKGITGLKMLPVDWNISVFSVRAGWTNWKPNFPPLYFFVLLSCLFVYFLFFSFLLPSFHPSFPYR